MKIFKINEVIKKEITGKGKESDVFRIEFIKSNWEKIVGKVLAQNSFPSYDKGTTLFVKVNNSVWIQQMQFYKKNIIEETNKILNGNYIKNINFFNGEIKKVNIKTEIENDDIIEREKLKDKVEKETLSQEEIYSIKKSLSSIESLDIKKTLYKIMVNIKKREKILIDEGYKNCRKCGIIHNEKGSICFLCKNNIANEKINLIKKTIINKPYISFSELKEIIPDITNEEYKKCLEYIKWKLMNKIEILKRRKETDKIYKVVQKYIMAETGIKNQELIENKVQLFIKRLGL